MKKRQFLILKWPEGIQARPDLSRSFSLLKELPDYDRKEVIHVLDVDGERMYFYPDEVKEVTDGE